MACGGVGQGSGGAQLHQPYLTAPYDYAYRQGP